MNNVHKVIAPRAGEGIKHVKVHRVLKPQGARVHADESIVEIETDKAAMEIASPVSGYMGEIFCSENDVVAVGDILLHVHASKETPSSNSTFGQIRRKEISNRSDEDETVKRLPEEQITLIRQMRLSQERIIQANIESQLIWDDIKTVKKRYRAEAHAERVPSSLNIIIWALSQAMFEFDKFRGKLIDDNSLSISKACFIGVAREKGNDCLETPVLSFERHTTLEGVQNLMAEVLKAAKPSPSSYHSISLSDMSSLQVRRGQPIVVYPAISTLFIGSPYQAISGEKISDMVLAFDHRAINGAYAAKFLKRINKRIKELAMKNPEERGFQ